jgi:hypothetical protein
MRLPLAFLLFLSPSPALAQALFGGVLAHDVHLPIDKGGFENGVALELGLRGAPIRSLHIIGSPYAIASVVPSGGTDFAAVGLSWLIGRGPLFLRPGAGLAIHSGAMPVYDRNGRRLDLGSRITFEPEVGIGARIGRRAAVEAVLVHLSHAQLFSRQNPGMDSLGLRFTYSLR